MYKLRKTVKIKKIHIRINNIYNNASTNVFNNKLLTNMSINGIIYIKNKKFNFFVCLYTYKCRI